MADILRSVSFVFYNVAGIANKRYDCDWVTQYVKQFDFVTKQTTSNTGHRNNRTKQLNLHLIFHRLTVV